MESDPRPRNRSGTSSALTESTARRLDNQIARALNETYGAQMGLRSLVHLATRQMLLGGATSAGIRDALTTRMATHNERTAGTPDAVIADERTTAALTRLMLSWAEELFPASYDQAPMQRASSAARDS